MVRKEKQEKNYNKNNKTNNRNQRNNNNNNNKNNNIITLDPRANYHRPETNPKHTNPTSETNNKPQTNPITHKDLRINLPEGVKRKGLSVDHDDSTIRK